MISVQQDVLSLFIKESLQDLFKLCYGVISYEAWYKGTPTFIESIDYRFWDLQPTRGSPPLPVEETAKCLQQDGRVPWFSQWFSERIWVLLLWILQGRTGAMAFVMFTRIQRSTVWQPQDHRHGHLHSASKNQSLKLLLVGLKLRREWLLFPEVYNLSLHFDGVEICPFMIFHDTQALDPDLSFARSK